MGGGQDDRVRQTQAAVTGPKLRGPLGRPGERGEKRKEKKKKKEKE
jgi:hypothetical protein